MRAIRSSEIKLVARSRGWKGKSGAPKEEIMKWLQDRGIGMNDIAGIVAQLRGFARTGNMPQSGEPAKADMAAVQQYVDSKVQDAIGQLSLNVDEATLGKLIATAVSKAQPERIILADGQKPVTLKHRTHPMFEKVTRLVRAGLNVLMVGPAGCGKTTLAEHVAKALKRKYGTMHCTAGMSEGHLTGWLLPVGHGKPGAFSYVASEFVTLFESGDSIFLLDEVDAADANVMLVLNAALSNGMLHVPHRYEEPHVQRGKNVAVIAAANTFGTGADMLYAGRNQLDAATLDRFYVVEMTYDAALESDITSRPAETVETWSPASADTMEADLNDLADWAVQLRKSVVEQRMRRVISTRTFQKAMAARKAGIPLVEIKRDLLAGWTRDELAKIGG